MAVKIANRDVRQHVLNLHPFQGNNIHAEYFCVNPKSALQGIMGDSGYVVFSYRTWPLLIAMILEPHGPTVWFENEDRYSVTTSKHRSQTHPHTDTIKLSRSAMLRLLNGGYRALAADRVIEGVV